MNPTNTAPDTTQAGGEGGAPALTTYAKLDDFFETVYSAKPDAEGYYGVGAYEGYLLCLFLRWKLEDEDAEQDELDKVNADLAVLNEEIGDAGRTQALRQLSLWISNGEGWLGSRLDELANPISACKVEA